MLRRRRRTTGSGRHCSYGEVDIIAGTPWLFSRPELFGALDTLFIDEAGQMSLANVVAVGGAARNIVLLGDPCQLAQPSRGHHPEGAEQSVLAHLLGENATMPVERGLFLETTWRMHPDICAYISEVMYAGRLSAHLSCGKQMVADGQRLGGTGLRYLPVRHSGNRAVSREEVSCVAEQVEDLLGRRWTDQHGATRQLDLDDILIVAPYNAQVNRLAAALPRGARVGTVDKFQGQEAPVVFYSMASSSADEAPRSFEFLYSLNRLNVAISRARGLAVLVCSPALLEARCRTPEQVRLVSALCRFAELARAQSA